MKNRQRQEKKFWDKFARRYDSYMKRTLDATYVSLLKNMKEDLKSSHKVLEIGAGTGLVTFAICSNVDSITATDISPEMIEVAKQKQTEQGIKNIDFQVQDSYQLNFPDKSFDVVIATNVLHLLYEPDRAFQEAKRLLKIGGIFIAPTFCMGETKKDILFAKFAGLVGGFKIINRWSLKGFEQQIIQNGFGIQKNELITGRFPLSYLVGEKKDA